VELSGSLAENGPVGAETAGVADEVTDAIDPHATAVAVNTSEIQFERRLMPDYKTPISAHRLRMTSLLFVADFQGCLSSSGDKVWCAINTICEPIANTAEDENSHNTMARRDLCVV